ncbi:MAG TPA: dihydrodipicolinate synthase family protein [Bryobacteraceae bacterium]|nr:dihydrodipicolinate synthase family protein [Bryobacteraceae bacterium]
MKLQGIFLPVAIPFDHNGDLYAVKVQHNVEKWNRTTLAGYVVSGPENDYLSVHEKNRMWEWVAEYSAPEKLLIMTAGAPGVRETIDTIHLADSLGYKAAMVRVPRESPVAQLVYFRAVADKSEVPIIIDGELPDESVAALAQHPHIAAMCRPSPRPVENFQVLASSELTLSESFAAGATGAVLSFANAAPHATISIWEAHRTRESDAARDWQTRIAPIVKMIGERGVAVLKHAMDLNGYYGGPPRLPLTGLTAEQKKSVEAALDGIKG